MGHGFTGSVKPCAIILKRIMKIETLIVTMHQNDHSLVERMNVQTDALVGNQCQTHSMDTFYQNGHKVIYFNTNERGVGRNRNLLLQNATADVWVLADDDMRFVDRYPQIAQKAFEECPNADILVFNLIEKNPRRYVNQKIVRVRWNNYAKYGAARLALRKKAFLSSGIRFHLSFGGGARYGSGEDTIFLKECLRKGLKIYAVPYALAEIDQESVSTWFSGYNEKFFHDKGALYSCLHPALWPAYAVRFLIRYRKKYGGEMPSIQALKYMIGGAVEYRAEVEDHHEV